MLQNEWPPGNHFGSHVHSKQWYSSSLIQWWSHGVWGTIFHTEIDTEAFGSFTTRPMGLFERRHSGLYLVDMKNLTVVNQDFEIILNQAAPSQTNGIQKVNNFLGDVMLAGIVKEFLQIVLKNLSVWNKYL